MIIAHGKNSTVQKAGLPENPKDEDHTMGVNILQSRRHINILLSRHSIGSKQPEMRARAAQRRLNDQNDSLDEENRQGGRGCTDNDSFSSLE